MHELMFQTGVKGTSERSELIPCINYKVFTHTLVYHTFPCNPVVNFHPLHLSESVPFAQPFLRFYVVAHFPVDAAA